VIDTLYAPRVLTADMNESFMFVCVNDSRARFMRLERMIF